MIFIEDKNKDNIIIWFWVKTLNGEKSIDGKKYETPLIFINKHFPKIYDEEFNIEYPKESAYIGNYNGKIDHTIIKDLAKKHDQIILLLPRLLKKDIKLLTKIEKEQNTQFIITVTNNKYANLEFYTIKYTRKHLIFLGERIKCFCNKTLKDKRGDLI